MKKICVLILTTMLLFAMTPLPVKAVLQTYNYTAVDDSDYTILLRLENNINGGGDFYTGYKLGDYYISGNVYYKGQPYSAIDWADKEYVIKEGKQTIEILLANFAERITLSIEIEGKPEPEKKVYGNMALEGQIIEGYTGLSADYVLPKVRFFGDGKELSGTFSVLDWDSSQEGLREFHWIFVPDDPSYETRTGTVKVKFLKGYTPEDTQESLEPTPPSLTASVVTLNTLTAYDINLDNKVSGSTYLWSSSDTDIVEVNPKNGLIKAKKEGRAIITCEITLPDGAKQTLSSVVNVGYDENAPTLTETVLDLEVGDKFDINLENKIAKSKYRWASSDRSVVIVNSSNGKVTAVGPGQAYVTCTITTPDRQVIVLRCDITVTEPEITE